MALDKVRIWERHNAQTELASAIARVKNELAAPTLKADEIFAPEATSHGDMRSRLLDALPDGEIEELVLLAQARDIRIRRRRRVNCWRHCLPTARSANHDPVGW